MESVSSSPAIANVILMSIMKKHNLTYACQADILNLLSIFCPSSAIPSSVYALNRYFVDLKKDVVMHYCCGACKALVSNSVTPNCCGTHALTQSLLKYHCIYKLLIRYSHMCVCIYIHTRGGWKLLQSLPLTQTVTVKLCWNEPWDLSTDGYNSMKKHREGLYDCVNNVNLHLRMSTSELYIYKLILCV